MDTTDKPTDRPKTRLYRWSGAAGILFLVIPALLWFLRAPFAEFAVRKVCSDRELSCVISIDRLTFGEVRASNIKISGNDEEEVPVSVKSLNVSFEWLGFLTPVVTSVKADHPELVVDTRGGKVRVPILEKFQGGPSDEESSFEVPPFAINDGELTVLTDAGSLYGRVSVSGSLQREVHSHLVLQPAKLVLEDSRIDLKAAEVRFILANGQITGHAVFELTDMSSGDAAAQNLKLTADITPTKTDTHDLNWAVEVASAAYQDARLQGLSAEGLASFALSGDDISLDAVRLKGLDAQLRTDGFRYGRIQMREARASLELKAENDGLRGPVSLISGLDIDQAVKAEKILVTGALSLDEQSLIVTSGVFAGAVSAERASMAPEVNGMLLGMLDLPDPFSAHGDALKKSVGRLLSLFSTGAEVEVGFSSETGDFSLTSVRPAVMRSADESVLISVRPPRNGSWFRFGEVGLELRGDWLLDDLKSEVELVVDGLDYKEDLVDGGMDLRVRDISVPDFQAERLGLGFGLKGLSYARSGSEQHFTLDGQLRLDGPAFGMELTSVQLGAQIAGFDSGSGWKLRLKDGDCLKLGFIRAELPAAAFGPANLDLCSQNRLLLDTKGKELSGMLAAKALRIPFQASAAAGEITLLSPHFTWILNDNFSLSVDGSKLSVPMIIGDKGTDSAQKAVYSSAAMKAGIQTEADGMNVFFGMKDSLFSLADLPVNISISGVSGKGEIGETGPDINYSVTGAKISDRLNPESNALYKPVQASGEGRMTEDTVTLQARVSLEGKNAFLGTLSVEHLLKANKGKAELSGGELAFKRDGLQLYDVSELLRGLAVSATGDIRPDASVSWVDGTLTSSGSVVVDDLSFSTFRLGRVEGVSGTLSFSDLIGLQTLPHQSLKIRALAFTPTLVLKDGEIDLAILGPDRFELERAIWPFVGGMISIAPTVWDIEGESQKVTVNADDWELLQLLNLFEVPDLKVAGRVSGVFPIEIVGANAYFRNAKLEATEAGYFSYKSDLTETAGQADQYSKMAFDALSNFEYRVMSLSANGNLTGNIILEMMLSGRNPQLLEGQIFNFNVTVDSDLAQLVRAGSLTSSSDAVQGVIVDLVKTNQGAGQSTGSN